MYYDYYDYGYDMGIGSAMEGVAGFLLVFLVIFYLAMISLCIVCYVLQSLGMYSIAKRRGIHHAWLAWIPVGDLWLLGSISDQYQYLAKGRVRNRRGLLLGLSIALYAMMVLMCVGIFLAMIGLSNMLSGVLLAVTVLCLIAYFVLAIVATVFQYIAMYDLYASSDPGNAVLYLVLSIVFSVAIPFFVFACRKKDMGMPARKTAQPVQPSVIEENAQEQTAEV